MFLAMTDLRTGTQWTMFRCTSITARSDSRNVEGSMSECPLCLGSSPFVVSGDQSGRFAMMIEFVASGITFAIPTLPLTITARANIFCFGCFPGLRRAKSDVIEQRQTADCGSDKILSFSSGPLIQF
jgi:hypothetical protein